MGSEQVAGPPVVVGHCHVMSFLGAGCPTGLPSPSAAGTVCPVPCPCRAAQGTQTGVPLEAVSVLLGTLGTPGSPGSAGTAGL